MAQISKDPPSHRRITWGLAPGVTHLSAVYDPIHQILTLSAEGKTNEIAHGFEFIRDERWVGGFRFFFNCWSGPALEHSHCYERTQGFNLAFTPHTAFGHVLVCTADHPTGRVVDVHWLGLKPETPNKPTAPISQPSDSAPGALILPPPIPITAILNKPFVISERTGSEGLTINYDPVFLTQQSAKLNPHGTMSWTFLPIRAGLTSAMTFTWPNPGIYGYKSAYDIDIFAPNATKSGPVTGDPATSAVLSFLGGLNIAIRQVQALYPSASLHSVSCTRPRGGPVYPVNSARAISQLTIVFRDRSSTTTPIEPAGSDKISIKDQGWWSSWDEPVRTPNFPLGTADIAWPPSEGTWTLGLEEAVNELLANPDAPKTFWSAEFFMPIRAAGPGGEERQPLYAFTMVDTSVWFVGAKDGKVWRPEGQKDVAVVGGKKAVGN